MIESFKNIEYLKHGNTRQQLAYAAIIGLRIFEILQPYNPMLTGTIPIEIDLPESDLDIICECENHEEFSKLISNHFHQKKGFEISTYTPSSGTTTTIATFESSNFIFEIFGQNIPTEKQNAYRHMLIEYRILAEKGEAFKNKIIQLKQEGIKTEPAFAKLLRLEGNPFDELLNWTAYEA